MKTPKDICPLCFKEINLALPHAYSRELKKPVHRECEKAYRLLEDFNDLVF